jgi:polysaccharide biosynthesis protein PslH
MEFFLNDIWPLIQARAPQASVEIAGKNPPVELLEFAGPRVRFLGYVPNLTQFLRSATAVIVPLRSGGGIKIKTLEALAAGAAVVSTSIGVEGIDGADGKHFLVRDDAESFATAVLRLLSMPSAFTGMRNCGRALVAAQYSPQAWSERFSALVPTQWRPARLRRPRGLTRRAGPRAV